MLHETIRNDEIAKLTVRNNVATYNVAEVVLR